ncbi:hypothetical protein SDC9_77290 [bioreactor metagenome]|uniref:Uncharacterized protein n=1 Tax=bioreactor metagenome TaxID=1076179 RepID=A0A644YQI5_9ZZZZ
MGGIFFAKDKIQSILSGRYFFTDCDTAGPICSLRVYRTHACMSFRTCWHCIKESNGYIDSVRGDDLSKFRVKQWVVDMVFMHIMFIVILYIVYIYIVPTIVPV